MAVSMKDEREEYTCSFNTTYHIKPVYGKGLWIITSNANHLPSRLEGMFTSHEEAEEAVRKFTDHQAANAFKETPELYAIRKEKEKLYKKERQENRKKAKEIAQSILEEAGKE